MTATKYKPDTELNHVNDPEGQKLFMCHIYPTTLKTNVSMGKFETTAPLHTHRPT